MNTFSCKNAVLLFLVLVLTSSFTTPSIAAPSDCTYEFQGKLFQNVQITIEDDTRGALSRTFDYYVPTAAYPAAAYNQLPLVFVLHGRGASADVIFGTADYFDWGYPWCQMMKEADRSRFIICAPDGYENSFGEQAWNDCRDDDPNSPRTNDVLFIEELIRWFVKNGYNINANKVYAAGFSNGAGMVFRLAAELGDHIAAVAAVASIMPRPTLSECSPPVEKVGIFLMNGTDDPLVPFEHSQSAIDYWLLYNRLSANGEFVRLPDNPALPEEPLTNLWTVLDRYSAPPEDLEGTQVCLYTVNNGGHCEPSIAEKYPDYYKYDLEAGFQCQDFEVTAEVWNFFKSQWLAEERLYRPTHAYAATGSGVGEAADLWLDDEGESGSYTIEADGGVAMLSATFSLLETLEAESVRVTAVMATSAPVWRSLLLWNVSKGAWDEVVSEKPGTIEKTLEATRSLNASDYVALNGQIKVAVETDGSDDPYQLRVDLLEVGVVPGSSYEAPVAVDDEYDVLENTTLSVVDGSILDNDIATAKITAHLADDVQNGTLQLFSDGTFTYQPDPGFNGTDLFTYRADDGSVTSNSATVTIEVIGTNVAPVAHDDDAQTVRNVAVTIAVLANDADEDGDALVIGQLPAGPANGGIVVNADNTVTYTPNIGFWGTDSFTYTANDGTSASNNATVTITVRRVAPSNEPPTAQGDYVVTTRNTSVTVTLLANDTDSDGTIDPTTVLIVSVPNRGGAAVVNGDGTVTYTPATDFLGTETFYYTVADNVGAVSNEASVTVNVQRSPKGNLWWIWFLLFSQ